MTETNTLKQQVNQLLNNELAAFCADFFNSEFDFEISKYSTDEELAAIALLEMQQIKVVNVDSYGGEGEGEDYWSVYKFSRGTEDVYIKFDGSYQSYDGSTYDEWYFVTAKPVVVTQYFKE